VLALPGDQLTFAARYRRKSRTKRELINERQLGYVPPAATSIVLLSAPIALLLAGLLAVLPAHRAARLCVAQLLRTE
jgi:hypothetical protein